MVAGGLRVVFINLRGELPQILLPLPPPPLFSRNTFIIIIVAVVTVIAKLYQDKGQNLTYHIFWRPYILLGSLGTPFKKSQGEQNPLWPQGTP